MQEYLNIFHKGGIQPMKKLSTWFPMYKLKDDVITVYQPSEIQISFDNLIGLENAKNDLKNIIDYIKNPDAFAKMGVRPHMHYLLQGPDGVGKTSLAYAVARAANIPIIVVDCSDFLDTRKKSFNLLKNSFKTASSYNYSVLLFKGFDRFFQINDNFKVSFLNELVHLMEEYTNVVVISTLSHPLLIAHGEYLFDENAFSKTIDINYPDLKNREEMYKLFCANIPIANNISFSRLAIDSYGMTAKDIKRIVKNATLLSVRNQSETITRECFDEIISLELLGQKRKKMTEKERLSTAYHEAGHVIAGYFSNPEYKLSKVEIIHRSESLGVTMPDYDEEKLTYFSKDYKYMIISAFGGMVAERIIFNDNSSGVSQDLAMATTYANLMVTTYGMCDQFGPISVPALRYPDDEDAEDLCIISESTMDEINKNISKILHDLYNTSFIVVNDHRQELEALTQALLEKEIVYGNEIKEIFEKFKSSEN